MLMFLLWMIVALLLGILWIIMLPWTAARIRGDPWIEKVSDHYIRFAQTGARRSALLVRDGDVKLIPKRYDSDLKGDKDTASGDERHHYDHFNVLSRLSNKIFGIAIPDTDSYVSPLLAEIGTKAKKKKDNREFGVKSGDMLDGIEIPERSQLVNLQRAKHLTSGASEPEMGKEVYEKTKISQEKFHEKISFGQGMIFIIGCVGMFAVAWFAASRGGASGQEVVENTTTVSTLASMFLGMALFGNDDDESESDEQSPTTSEPLASSDGEDGSDDGRGWFEWDIDKARLGAWAWIIGWIVLVPLLGVIFAGAATALLMVIVALAVALGIPAIIILMGPSIPITLGMPIARGCWILAQLTVGQGVLVERDSGKLEHRQLRIADDDVDWDYYAILSDGKYLEIDGTAGDLMRFAWAPLGATAEKSEQNMDELSFGINKVSADGGRVVSKEMRKGYKPKLKVPTQERSWIVTAPQLWQMCAKTSESQAVQQGRNKAMTEYGGEQQISMILFLGLLLFGMMMSGFMGLVGGGAIL